MRQNQLIDNTNRFKSIKELNTCGIFLTSKFSITIKTRALCIDKSETKSNIYD